MGESMGGGWSLLVGRTTYEDLYEGWPTRQPSSPMTQALTSVQKVVATHDPNYKLPWENSTSLLTLARVGAAASASAPHSACGARSPFSAARVFCPRDHYSVVVPPRRIRGVAAPTLLRMCRSCARACSAHPWMSSHTALWRRLCVRIWVTVPTHARDRTARAVASVRRSCCCWHTC